MSRGGVRAAVVNWKVTPAKTLGDYQGHFTRLAEEVLAGAAELAVFPELTILELLGLAPGLEGRDQARFLADHAEVHESLVRDLAAQGVTVVGGSHLVHDGPSVRNVALVAAPHGESRQPKNIVTTQERDDWHLAEGGGLARTPDPWLGVTVCYDCEFPGSGRVLAEAGVLVQAVPAWTETRHGFQRVRWSCHARAVEHQVFVLHASLVGGLGMDPMPFAYGTSAVLTPSVAPFPESAILAETPLHEEAVAFADLDFQAIEAGRNAGDVRNWHHRDRGEWRLNEP